MDSELKKKLTEKMEKAVGSLKKDLASIRTGRASLTIFDELMIDYFGTPTPLGHIATLSVPDSKTITIQPWDAKIISEIEKAIQKSDLGLNPNNDGKMIRISIPALTEDRRKELVKTVHKKGEDGKIAVRSIRRECNDEIKKIEKEEHLSEDETKRSMDENQKLTDSYVKKIDEIISHKEAEVMEV